MEIWLKKTNKESSDEERNCQQNFGIDGEAKSEDRNLKRLNTIGLELMRGKISSSPGNWKQEDGRNSLVLLGI